LRRESRSSAWKWTRFGEHYDLDVDDLSRGFPRQALDSVGLRRDGVDAF
jgi:hypothetical protein